MFVLSKANEEVFQLALIGACNEGFAASYKLVFAARLDGINKAE